MCECSEGATCECEFSRSAPGECVHVVKVPLVRECSEGTTGECEFSGSATGECVNVVKMPLVCACSEGATGECVHVVKVPLVSVKLGEAPECVIREEFPKFL